MLRDLAGFVTLPVINDVMLAECTASGHIMLYLLNWAARVPVVVIIYQIVQHTWVNTEHCYHYPAGE